MELRNINSFIKITELGSFSHAAEALGYAQSTITFQIKQLEEELGYSLFERIGKRITLTNYGETFLPLAKQMTNLSTEMKSIGKINKNISGTIRMGMVESFFFSKLLTLLPQFRKEFSNFSFVLKTRPSVELLDELQRNNLDIICCLSKEALPSSCSVVYSRDVEMAFLASNSINLSTNKKTSLAQIANEEIVLTEENSVYHQSILKVFQEKGLTIKQHYRVESTWAIVNMLLYGNGISYLPSYVARDEVAEKKLKIIKPKDFASHIKVVVAINQSKWLSPQIKFLIKLLQEESWL